MSVNPSAHPLDPWLESKDWSLHPHQVETLRAVQEKSCLVIAPTGGGKTLCGFLPLLNQIDHDTPKPGLVGLYISPLKALTKDVHRNLLDPLEFIGSKIRCEIRTGDTPSHRRRAQMKNPPHLLMTTPESLALMNSHADASSLFYSLQYVIIDEIHALADNKRGDLLSLHLARLRNLAPAHRIIALSATVKTPSQLQKWLSPQDPESVHLINAYQQGSQETGPADLSLHCPNERLPWSGHGATHAADDILKFIRAHRSTIVFVNTRAQAERLYRDLQERISLSIKPDQKQIRLGLHHGSLEKELRLAAEDAMASGKLDALIATSSLDLGIDWGAVDLVIQAGPPKGVARLMQRIGRSNHQLDKASKAIVIPTQCMESIETVAAIEQVLAGKPDNEFLRDGSLDVLMQYTIGRIASSPLAADELYREVITAGPYANLSRDDFDRVLEFNSTGGYALKAYPQFQRICLNSQNQLTLSDEKLARQHRMNIGTIVSYPHLKVKLGRNRGIGEIEERFVQQLEPGMSFQFGGRLLRFEGIKDSTVQVSPARGAANIIPAFAGGRLPLSSSLSEEVRNLISKKARWKELPEQTRGWLEKQAERSGIPAPDHLLVESFPRSGKHFFVTYPFAGRNAHQTLGLLLSRRMEQSGLQPLGFVANDYAVAISSLQPITDPAIIPSLFDPDDFEKEIHTWMSSSYLLKRTFREVALVSGLIDRSYPGRKKTGRQVTFSSDLIYDVLHQYEPDHILLKATQREAERGLVAWDRLRSVLNEFHGKYAFKCLDRISPFAVPVVMEVSQESIDGSAVEALLDAREEDLLREAGLTS
ncbi:MAG: ligase-associated DNA damage response DEXH box helicase [Verrucomicrobiota bacterium]